MMPVVRGEEITKRQSVFCAGLLLGATVMLTSARLGWVYLLIEGPLGLAFFAANVRLLREKLPDVKWAKRTFGLSVLFMSGVVVAMVLGIVM